MKGLVTNIQKYSIHDGPGIRTTVFFKGCPLCCPWCHNPEGQGSGVQLIWQKEKCIGCGSCVEACPEQGLTLTAAGIVRDTARCRSCGACADACPALAWEQIGREYTADQLMAEIRKDAVFYEQSGGGVTFSGGEPLMQGDLLLELLNRCKAEGFHTVVDTSGFTSAEMITAAAKSTDLFLFDLKHMDPVQHEALMGVPLEPILDNLHLLRQMGASVWIRYPMIPGINDGEQALDAMVQLMEELGLRDISVLPYHRWAEGKYVKLGLTPPLCDVAEPSETQVEQIAARFRAHGFQVRIGG